LLTFYFLQSIGNNDKDPTGQSQRWNSLEIAHGSYTLDDCVGDIAELKFEKPVSIRPHTKYGLRLRNHGGRTSNGDGGMQAKPIYFMLLTRQLILYSPYVGTSTVKGPDGTTFTFTSCSLSFNGTNPTRGQIPQILYFR
jgi:E3 ubiquitin-protein ligase MYCBP2